MYISQSAAQAIVSEIGNEIHERINLMDATGCIIASTDMTRIGTIHEGAKRIVDEQLEQLYITPQTESKTAKVGLNLPLVVQNEIVGVIGITGKREQVEPFGNIVRHVTEIMIEDSIVKDERRLDRRVRYRFLESWIKDNAMALNPQFIERGRKLNIDIQKPRRVIMFRLDNFLQLSGQIEGQKIMEDIETLIRHEVYKIPDALYLREPTRQICFIPTISDYEIKKFAQKIAKAVWQRFEEKVIAGVDGHTSGDIMVHELCTEAGKALESCISEDRWLVFYNDLNIEIFMNEVSDKSKLQYINKIFENIEREEVDYYMQIIEAYFEHDGSINKTADKLYIHKNTLQYKIKKLEEITGLDIRKPSNASLLYVTMVFYKSLYGGEYLTRT